jgi:uncharacterized OsmC-like protein
LISHAIGEVEAEGKILLLRRIHVTYELKLDASQKETAERVHALHAQNCPVARSIGDSVKISTSLEMEYLSDPGSNL